MWKSRDTDMPVVLDQALTGCMVIFSCLEKEIQRITTGAPEPSRIRWRPRARMVWNESHLNDLLSSLRGQQTAITLLIQLLQMSTLTEMKDMLQRKSEAVRSSAHQTLSLRSKNPSVAVPNSIFGDRNQNPVSQGHDVASIVAPSELEFEFDDIVVNSQAYRRVLARAHQATTPTMERVKTGRQTEQEHSFTEQGKWVHADESSLQFKGTAHVGDNRDIPLKGLFDTGSERNFVSLSFLHKYGIYDAVVRKLPHPETVKGAEMMMETKVEHEASLQWCMDGSNIRTDTFSVIDNDGNSYDILLGWEFIIQNEIFVVKKKALDRVRRGRTGGVTTQAK